MQMITVEQIKAARAMLDMKQHELAKKAGVSTGTLNNIERGFQKDPKISTLNAIQKTLKAEGIEFTEGEEGSFGVQYKPREKNNISTLLIIDDSDTDRKLYKAWLNQEGGKKYNIVEAANAKDGLEVFLKTKPACIILDFMMYGKDGFQLLMQMKEELLKIPPIIFVTAYQSFIVKKTALDAGVHAHLNKNALTKEELCEAVISALE